MSGENIYGVYRSPRASGVESLILTSPIHEDCRSVGSVAMTLALAHYFRQQTHWAKDIVFLFTEHGLYGIKAWLQSYHGDREEGE